MLKVNIEKGKMIDVSVGGTVQEFSAEFLTLIESVYDRLDGECADFFQEVMTLYLPACFMNDEDREKYLYKLSHGEGTEEEDIEGLSEKEIDDLIGAMEGLKDLLTKKKEDKKNEAICNQA